MQEIGIYLRREFFSHGQLYVAMSRVGNPSKISIYAPNGTYKSKDGVYIDNIVYKEIL